MNDTAPDVAELVRDRHRQMTPEARMRIASDMFDAARAIIESSLPADLPRRERRLALARRLYAGEFSEAVLVQYAEYEAPSPFFA